MVSDDDELAHALMVVANAGFDVILPGKLEELRAMAAPDGRRRVMPPDRDWSSSAN